MWKKTIAILALCGLILCSTISVFAMNAEIQIEPDDNPALIYVGVDIAVILSDQIPQSAAEWDNLSHVRRILTRQKKIQITMDENFPKGSYILAERILYTPVGEEDQNTIIIGDADGKTKGWTVIPHSNFEIGKDEVPPSPSPLPEKPVGEPESHGTFHLLKMGYSIKNPDGYIYGYPDGTFRPNASVTRAEFIAMLDRLVQKNQTEIDLGIKDIEGHWAYTNIKNWEAECVDIAKDSKFHPDQPITREEIADVCDKIFNSPQHPTTDFFSDIKDNPYRKEINDLGYAGIMKGYQGEFRPENTLTRAEMVTLFNQNFLSEKRKLQTNIFKDIQQENWYYNDILRAIK